MLFKIHFLKMGGNKVCTRCIMQSVWNVDWWVGWANVLEVLPHLSQRSASVQPV